MVHLANFIKLIFAFFCRKNIFGEAVLRPLAGCAREQLPRLLPQLSFPTAEVVAAFATAFFRTTPNSAVAAAFYPAPAGRRQERRRILFRGVNATLPPEAKKILKI